MRHHFQPKTRWLLAVMVSLMAATGQESLRSEIKAPPIGYIYPSGETYVFSVEWHSLTAGTAVLKMESVDGQQRVTATGHTSGIGNLIYKVNDQFEARFDGKTFCSAAVFKHVEEGSRRRQSELRFDYAARKGIFETKDLKSGEQKRMESDIPDCVTDVLSGFYYLASLTLAPGASTQFSMSDGGKTSDVLATAESKEKIKVPAGNFSTLRIKAEPVSGALKGKGAIWIWYSEDANRMPVQMRSKLGWGTLLFRLQRHDK